MTYKKANLNIGLLVFYLISADERVHLHYQSGSIPMQFSTIEYMSTHSKESDYLQNRPQTVKVGGEISNRLTIKCRVPQGSILGPLLFLIYIKDIYK